MNSNLQLLQPYPFTRLRELLSGIEGNPELRPIRLSIGEPKQPAYQAAIDALSSNLTGVSQYPATSGTMEFKQAVARWLKQRFSLLSIDAEKQILPVNGTREALFSVAQALVGSTAKKDQQSSILMPNPFYQIYEGAALLSGCEPVFFGLDPTTNQPDIDSIDESDLQRSEMMYICTPGNPTGQSLPLNTLKKLILLAQKHDFVLVSDECYSELYLDDKAPCTGLLEACEQLGLNDYNNCLVFHSLSKRSNLPGLRSGFVAGDSALIEKFLLYRTYHGSAMALHHQKASIAAWGDEQHVQQNRALYRDKYAAVMPILRQQFDFIEPDSGFYLWLSTPIDDQVFAKTLFAEQNLIVIPGTFLARQVQGINPGQNRIRIALVSDIEQCIEAAHRLCHFAASLNS